MAQEIVFYCDVCLDEGDKSPSTRYVVALGRQQPLAIDLCTKHQNELIEPLRNALQHFGDKNLEVPGAASSAMPLRRNAWPCLLCTAAFSSQHSFSGHMAAEHNTSPKPFYGAQCPIDGETYGLGGPLGTHMARMHKDKGQTTAEVFVTAKKEGDPHGVIERVLAAYDGAAEKNG